MITIYALRKSKEIVYIGQTKNLENRVKSHKTDKDFDSYEVLYVKPSKEEALKLEDLEIMKNNPIYNKRLNKGGSYENLKNGCKRLKANYENMISWIKHYSIEPIFKDNYSLNDLKWIADKSKEGKAEDRKIHLSLYFKSKTIEDLKEIHKLEEYNEKYIIRKIIESYVEENKNN